MEALFITPGRPVFYQLRKSRSTCPPYVEPFRSARPRRDASTSLPRLIASPLNASAATRIPPRADDNSSEMEDSYSEQRWRKQNANLVTEAQQNGLDSAMELLWSLTNDGTAVTQNFNQVVSLLAGKGRFDDGLQLADDAGRRGLANIITFRPLMKRCCAHGDGRGAKRVWKSMSRWGIEGDMFLYAELMGALVRSQDMTSAQRVLTSLHESGRRPHIVLYNTLLKGYARRANVRRGFEILNTIEEAEIKPDETTFNTLLNICVRAKDPDSLHRAMGLMHKHKVKPGAPTFNTILKLYSRAGQFENALAIFQEMQQTVEPSIVTFNTLIDGCAHRGDMAQAAQFFDEMVERGMSPDICTMTSLLKGFGRANEPERAVALFEGMKEGGFKIEERTRYAVINACLRSNERTEAKKLVSEMTELGLKVRVRTWIWLLECDVWADDEQSGLDTLRMMYSNGASLDMSSKSMLIRETRDRGGFLRLQRELKNVKTAEIRD